jgi:hypothetical protein
MWRVWLAALVWLGLPAAVCAADQLRVIVQPGKATAGEVFGQQPVVQILDSSGAPKKVSNGWALVEMGQNPSGFSVVVPPMDYQTPVETPTPTPGYVRFPFVEGIAVMSGLYINDLGAGFTLKIWSFSHKLKVFTAPFAVTMGAPFKIALATQPGTASGGAFFTPQPTVAIQDKGGNIVNTQNSGTVTVSISSNPVAGTLAYPANGKTLTFNQGQAPYQQLKVDVAGSPYRLKFVTSLPLAGGQEVESFPFSVGVGPAFKLRFLVNPSGVRGGAAFTTQPKIEVLDAGGNRLMEDSVSKIKAYIHTNPAAGTLEPVENRETQLVKGVASFHNLRIDKVGNDYSLRFYLLANTPGTAIWTPTGLTADSPNFNVVLGEPQSLAVSTPPSNAWAGGAPIGTQPIVELRDLGGNVIKTDGTSTVTAQIATSLAVTSSIVVDTSLATTTVVSKVSSLKPMDEDGYGLGEVIDIIVTFNQEVVVTPATGSGAMPTLLLATSGVADQSATCTTTLQSLTHVFRYVVQPGDFSTDLDYRSVSAFTLNGATIKDGNGQAARLVLPVPGAANSLAAGNALAISTATPEVTNINSTAPGNGRFGAGEFVDILVDYSLPVAVTGGPRLLMVAGGPIARYANFVEIVPGTAFKTVLFRYIVQQGDASADLDHDNIIDVNGGSIKRKSTTPATFASIVLNTPLLTGKRLADNNDIVIVTSAPEVDRVVGITTDKPAGTYTAGEEIFIDIPFTEQVVVTGIPRLKVKTGIVDADADYIGMGSGTRVLRFLYTVISPHLSSDLDFTSNSALLLNGGTIRRYVSRGTAITDANIDLAPVRNGLKSLQDNLLQAGNADIVVDGSNTFITAIKFITPDGTYTRNENIDIKVSFSANVDVDCTKGTPAIKLETGNAKADGWAIFFSGSGTKHLIFRYVVMMGDFPLSGKLDYFDQRAFSRYSPWEGKADKLINGGTIRRSSSFPLLDATLTLDRPTFAMGTIAIDTRAEKAKTVVYKVTTPTPAGTYGVDEVIYINVETTDEVLIALGQPALLVNAGATSYARWDAGRGTTTQRFVYRVQPGDMAAILSFKDTSSLLCSTQAVTGVGMLGAPIKNYNHVASDPNEHIDCDLSLAGSIASETGGIIKIDTTPPVVVSVHSPTPTNPLNDGFYVIGDVITIIVTFSEEVIIKPPPELLPDQTPLLILKTDGAPFQTLFLRSVQHQAKYVGIGPGGYKEAKFEYIVQPGDYSLNLQYASITALHLNSGQATIQRMCNSPKTPTNAVLTLPAVAPLHPSQLIKISGDSDSFLPKVVNVTSDKASGTYGGGESIYVHVHFSLDVRLNCYRDALNQCTRTPYIVLELGSVDRKAYWDQDLATAEAAGARILTFKYTVQAGDFTYNLDYVDSNSLQLGVGSVTGTILHAATTPTTTADLTLPAQSGVGSLGANSAIAIDGLSPFIKRVFSSSSLNCKLFLSGLCALGYQEVGANLDISLEFSSPVKIGVNATLHGAVASSTHVAAHPYLVLNMGVLPAFKRKALYLSGDGSTQLTFRYTVQTGDTSLDLDYDTSTSLVIQNGTTLRRFSVDPTVDADPWLNPPGGALLGSLSRTCAVGVVKYRDLLVDKRGKAYKLYFTTTTGKGLYVYSAFDVIYSSEFEVMASDKTRQDEFGTAVSVNADTAVIGAIKSHEPVYDTQVIQTSGFSSSYVREVQTVRTLATPVLCVQSIGTAADPYATIGGTFVIWWGKLGPTRALPYNIHPESLSTLLYLDIPALGRTKVERADNTYCACTGAYTWTITFEELGGAVETLTVVHSLTGTGVVMPSKATMAVASTALGGAFQLAAGHGKMKSITLPHNASVTQMDEGLRYDLGLPVFKVARETFPDPQGGFTWLVTFTSDSKYSDVPQLIGSGIGLAGYGATVRTSTLTEGKAPLSGSFKLSFREDTIANSTTASIPFDASAAVMKARLEALESIDTVDVARTGPASDNGYEWTVTFKKVRKFTKYGVLAEQIEGTTRTDFIFENLPALKSTTARRLDLVVAPDCQGLDPRACPPTPQAFSAGWTSPPGMPYVPLAPTPAPMLVASATDFQAGEELVALSKHEMVVYKNDWGKYRLNKIPGQIAYSAYTKYIRPDRYPHSGACSLTKGFMGGGAAFTISEAQTAYIGCANFLGDNTTFGYDAAGSSATGNLFSVSHKGPAGLGWTQIPLPYPIGNHTDLPLQHSHPATWYFKYLVPGSHSVCCDGTWGTGVVLVPYVAPPQPFAPCRHEEHPSCTPEKESADRHPYHLSLANTSGLLLGTSAMVTVDAVTKGSTAPFWEAQKSGDLGAEAGAAYIFVRQGEQWAEQQKLVGSDTNAYDRLGASVGVQGNLAIIGAPGASDNVVDSMTYNDPGLAGSDEYKKRFSGPYEQQTITCTATGGTFRLAFRGATSEPISYSVTSAQLKDELEKLPTIHSVVVKTSYGPLCSATPTPVVITFLGPDGNFEPMVPFGVWENAAILQPASATIVVNTVTEGEDRRTKRGQSCGAAYLFRRNTTTFHWTQESKILPENPTVSADFGWSVSAGINAHVANTAATDGNVAVVGAPGEEDDRGVIYIFRRSPVSLNHYDNNVWVQAQRLTSSLYSAVSHAGPSNPGQTWSWPKGGRLGHSVAMDELGDTIVVGAIGVDSERGAAYVLKRNPNMDYQFYQRLHAPTLQAGDKFGSSVAISGNTIVVGASTSDVHGRDAGAVYTFTRKNHHQFFYLTQTLKASDAHDDDRFGRSVAISENTVVVAAHEQFNGALNPRAAVQTITSTALSIIGGYFRVGYKTYKDDNVWEYRESRKLKHDVTKDELKEFIELDLDTQELLVSRTAADAQGGYEWKITFVGAAQMLGVPVVELNAESDADHPLTGTDVDIVAKMDVPTSQSLRGNAYVFTRPDDTQPWTEQASLFPKSKQYTELFGMAAAVHRETALVGAPNRDTYVSEINGGAGFFFDLGFLNIGFSQKKYTVTEGSTLTIPVLRCGNIGKCHTGKTYSKREEIMNFDTGDVVSSERTNQLKLTKFLNTGWGQLNQLVQPKGTGHYYPDVQKWLQPSQVSTAVERAQSYGGATERRSVFVNTQYDFEGISDYDPASGELSFPEFGGMLSFDFKTTDDSLVEAPDEFAMLRLSLPGVLPTYGGNLWSTVTIVDDGDGMTTSPLRAYTTKVYAGDDVNPPETWPSAMTAGSEFGFALGVDSTRGFAAVGAPEKLKKLGSVLKRTGSAYIYAYASGIWSQAAELAPTAGYVELSRFGESVDIDGYLMNDVRAIIGAPGVAKAYIFVRNSATGAWSQEAILTALEATRPEHRFAQQHAVAIHGDYAVVGAPGLEAIFVYTRNPTSGVWGTGKLMRSSDYDYDRILGYDHIHRPGFGCAVDISWRTIVAGAERAEYGNRGKTQIGTGDISVESYHTDGLDPDYFGRGGVYLMYTQPQAQTVTLLNDMLSDELKAGTFKLSMTIRGVTTRTAAIQFKAKETEMQTALQSLANVDWTVVTRTGNEKSGFVWSVTFQSEVEVLPLLQVTWDGFGCSDCVAMSSIYPNPALQMATRRIADLGPWYEVWSLQAPDKNPDDHFGSAVAISNDQLLVGAWGSSALTTTTWDFETGDLIGWRKTGDAFNYQPTYGDNSAARGVYDGMEEDSEQTMEYNARYGQGQSSQLQGRYYIGTYEKRPGKGWVQTAQENNHNNGSFPGHWRASDYKDPSTFAPGTVQGDVPQGTLTSQPFVFNGTTIKFRVGGGCNVGGDYWNPLTELGIGGGVYVELLVDGVSVVKTTGRCSEMMHWAKWDVAQYKSRIGQIRVVDASSANWGHINFDDLRFDWDVVPERTPDAGAAYVFRRKIATRYAMDFRLAGRFAGSPAHMLTDVAALLCRAMIRPL